MVAITSFTTLTTFATYAMLVATQSTTPTSSGTTPSTSAAPSAPSASPASPGASGVPIPSVGTANKSEVAWAVFNGPKVTGNILFQGYDNKTTLVTVNITVGLTDDSAEYPYHIHRFPVSSDGNCTSTGSHLDPAGVTDAVPCNSDIPSACEEGDLSGKHGKLDGSDSGKSDESYTDDYLGWTDPNDTILGRSVVIHFPNGTRYACANITAVADKSGSGSSGNNPSNNNGGNNPSSNNPGNNTNNGNSNNGVSSLNVNLISSITIHLIPMLVFRLMF